MSMSNIEFIRTRVIRGGLVKLIAQAANFAIRIGSLMVLARLLDPKDFGLVGMVTAVTGILALFRDFGLSSASVQRATVTSEQTATMFWINLILGAVLMLVALALAPALAAFYSEPRLLWVTSVISLAYLFNGAGVQHLALMQREMRFVTLAMIEMLLTGGRRRRRDWRCVGWLRILGISGHERQHSTHDDGGALVRHRLGSRPAAARNRHLVDDTLWRGDDTEWRPLVYCQQLR